jgi:hypothetical protein
MPRHESNTAVQEPDVEAITGSVDTEVDVPGSSTPATDAPAPKAKAEPKRGELPEGYVTPIGLAKALSQEKDGTNDSVKPQMVYSYIKNAPAAHPFPSEVVTDSIGAQRNALKLEEGLKWFHEKDARVAERKQNAAAKAEKKAAKASTSETPAATEPAGEVTEAE